MRISDWSSDVCSSDLFATRLHLALARVGKVELLHVLDRVAGLRGAECLAHHPVQIDQLVMAQQVVDFYLPSAVQHGKPLESRLLVGGVVLDRSEEHTSELQSLMRSSYAVFSSKKKRAPSITSSALAE